jgi:hypothetical protein
MTAGWGRGCGQQLTPDGWDGDRPTRPPRSQQWSPKDQLLSLHPGRSEDFPVFFLARREPINKATGTYSVCFCQSQEGNNS